ncbi:hypothetical protein ACFL03_06590 [Thermodesulfobacteriota bacterium]
MIDTIRDMARKRYWRLKLTEKPCSSLIKAAISLRDWTLNFQLDPGVKVGLVSCGIGTNEHTVLAKGLVRHEMGHWEVCPFDSEGEFLITEPISRLVRKRFKNKSKKKITACIQLLSNMVADVIVDTVIALSDRKSTYADAQALFFLKELRLDHSFSSFYDLFVRLNLMLWGSRSLVSERIVLNLPDYGNDGFLDGIRGAFPDLHEHDYMVSWLRNRGNWPKLAKVLGLLFLKRISGSHNVPSWWRPSPFRDVLSVLYEGRTDDVRIDTTSESGSLSMWPVSSMLCQPVDPIAAPELERLVWPQTLCMPNRNGQHRLLFQQTEINIESPVRYDQTQGFLPDLAFLLDSSGSMGYEPFEGTGEYNLLLRTAFGVFQWLKSKGLAAFLKYAVLNFSSKTDYSGWHNWNRKEILYQTLFNYQGGGTELGLKQLERLVKEAKRPFMALMISDGELDNAEPAEKFVRNHFTPPHGLVLVQIGKISSFARNLRSNGFGVHVLNDCSDLRDLVLGEINQRYAI